MFSRNLTPGSNNAVLGQRERGGLLRRVEVVDLGIVDHYHVNCLIHIPSNDVAQGAFIHLVYSDEVEMPVKLADNDNSGFILQLASASALLSADMGLVHPYRARELRAINFGQRSTDPVAEIPRSLVGDSEGSLNLMGTHSVARFTEQICCYEPLPQRQVRVMEDCAVCYGKLIVA